MYEIRIGTLAPFLLELLCGLGLRSMQRSVRQGEIRLKDRLGHGSPENPRALIVCGEMVAAADCGMMV